MNEDDDDQMKRGLFKKKYYDYLDQIFSTIVTFFIES